MSSKINSILTDVLEKIEPSENEITILENCIKDFVEKFGEKLKDMKIDAEVFVGGSFAKKTMIKKGKYDIDIFIRFKKDYEEISNLTERILKEMKIKDFLTIHGSRNYFRIRINPNIYFELIPVIKIKNLKDYDNITDLSYLHVKYINQKIKSQRDLDEIKLAKAFCYANKCYGAESYINGFSGYALELLVYHYGSFLKFIQAVSKMENKIVIDIEKQHKNKQAVMMDLNNSKLNSPIILIDPTYKQRNALSALSKETFDKFKKASKKFLKNPSVKSFEIQETDFSKIMAKKGEQEFVLIQAKTRKPAGDVAGTKLLKFYKHLSKEMENFFTIRKKEFDYSENKQSARYLFVVKTKNEILFNGPKLNDEDNVERFKKKHENIFEKKGKLYAKEKIRFGIKEFIELWKKKNESKIKEMNISELRVVK